jgi:hypothetical protein
MKYAKKKYILIFGILVLVILLGFLGKGLFFSTFSNFDSNILYCGNIYSDTERESGFGSSSSSIYFGSDNYDEQKHRAYIDFDISNIPDEAKIKKVVLETMVHGANGDFDSREYIRGSEMMGIDIRQLYENGQKQLAFETLGSGKVYKTLLGSNRLLISDGIKRLDLGEEVASDLQDSLSEDYFTLVFDTNFDGENEDGGYLDKYITKLKLDYITKIKVIRYEYGTCKEKEIYEDERTNLDFDTLEACNDYIENSRITIYRLENNQCSEMKILPTERKENDFESLEECKNLVVKPLNIILIIFGIAIGLVGILALTIWGYKKLK